MKRVALIGASGGIGMGLLSALLQRSDIEAIFATYHRSMGATSVGHIKSQGLEASISWSKLDASDETAVADWMGSIGRLDWLINCVGMLHDDNHGPEKGIHAFTPDHFISSIQINTLPTLLLAKYARDLLKDAPEPVFVSISARVGSISDNHLGGWYSYRASKAALNMVLKCLSIEWARTAKNIRVAALHPGTTDTRLSKPFQKNLPAGQLFSCETSAEYLMSQIETLKDRPSGQFIAYDGQEIPW
ncbi:MAG: SDR family NAD(P)-dependent oxidoreductase [Granulosicoccus sp.]|nr:SDR family NAD(P)-dependent oxidoreductase [Granulosicoccus sp.]